MLLRTKGLLLIAQSALLCRAQTGTELDLFLHFDTPPSPIFLGSMEKELGAILLPADFRLRWLEREEGVRPPAHLRVDLRFHGICKAASIPAIISPGRVSLADTGRSGNVILPFTDTNCDRLRNFLAPPYADPGTDDDQRMGRAMARVLAHELYHFLLQTTAHSKTGIAKAVHTPAALLGRSLTFESGELERIRASYSIPAN